MRGPDPPFRADTVERPAGLIYLWSSRQASNYLRIQPNPWRPRWASPCS